MASSTPDAPAGVDVKTGKPIDPEVGGIVNTKDLPGIRGNAADGLVENIGSEDGKRPALSELKSILYVGRSNSVSISVEDFKANGVEAPNDLEWNADNDFQVPISAANAAVVDYLIAEPGFSVI